MRKRGATHLEGDAGDAAQSFIYIKDLLRHRSGVTYQQRAGRPALRVELRACGGWPAAFLADFGKSVRIARKESFRSFISGVRQEADRMETYSELLWGMAGAPSRFAVEVN